MPNKPSGGPCGLALPVPPSQLPEIICLCAFTGGTVCSQKKKKKKLLRWGGQVLTEHRTVFYKLGAMNETCRQLYSFALACYFSIREEKIFIIALEPYMISNSFIERLGTLPSNTLDLLLINETILKGKMCLRFPEVGQTLRHPDTILAIEHLPLNRLKGFFNSFLAVNHLQPNGRNC